MSTPPRTTFSTWPTPLEPHPKLSTALGLLADDLWIKRDDLTGLAGGGNKVRKLEYICAEARERGAKVLVTIGAAQSNHARLTAAAGAALGLQVLLVLAGNRPLNYTGNIALSQMLGAAIIWAGDADEQALEDRARQEVVRFERSGRPAIFIPLGGSSALGARGYMDCGHELVAQCTDLTYVVTALGSGGTMAGLVSALGPKRVLGVNVGALANPEEHVRSIVSEMMQSNFTETLNIRHDQIGSAYKDVTKEVLSGLRLAATHSGIVLDPIYTGRSFSGLIAAIREGQIRPGDKIIYLHTGGLPGFFGNEDVLRFVESL